MSLISRWTSPTPDFFKKIIKISLTIAAGAGAALMVDPIGGAMISGFTFKLHPIVELICKNLAVSIPKTLIFLYLIRYKNVKHHKKVPFRVCF